MWLIKSLSSVWFADGTTLYASGTDYSDLITQFNSELIYIAWWTKANMFSLNVGKTFAFLMMGHEKSDTI